MPRLFRGMKEDPVEEPLLEQSARGLGVRPGVDVPAVDLQELVRPGEGGISVAPDDPQNLPEHRRNAIASTQEHWHKIEAPTDDT